MKTVAEVITGCINCNICVKECVFLTLHGTPGAISKQHQNKAFAKSPLFGCNLCGLCNSLCPKALDITGAFLDLRREIQQAGQHIPATVSSDSRHKKICSYEKTGCSTLFSFHHLPDDCDTVFFPGCTLTATRSAVTHRAYSYLQSINPNCGLVLDCCGKPSHDLGLEGNFQPMFSRLSNRLRSGGVKKIITGCPSCYVTFKKYLPECQTRTVYEELAENPPPLPDNLQETVTIHDTCVTRDEPAIHEAVRTLLTTSSGVIAEGKHNRGTALCCGEGAAASFIAPELTTNWKTTRRREANGFRVITYCAGCSSTLGKDLQTTHLLDLLFDYDRAIAGKEQRTRSPFTYLRRLLLKWQLTRSKTARAEPLHQRRLTPEGLARCIILLLLVAVTAGLQLLGITDLFSAEGVGELFTRLQNCHPVVYILAFGLGMVLPLPASPFVIVSGLLYGPYWGMVYAILGATTGASAAFLVSRYLSAEFVRQRLTGSRWLSLQDKVETHGWKMVAFSRLVPLFPFTLVNYAFGMTQVKFSHYVITTGICMIPACLAFTIFSSSLPDIYHGHISRNFILGLALIGLIAALPVVYNYLPPANRKVSRD